MPAVIEIDDALIAAAMLEGGFLSPKEAVETALREMLDRLKQRRGLRALRGKVDWIGDLDEMRRSSFDAP
jgi:Arc/MetJ family transcription regulator